MLPRDRGGAAANGGGPTLRDIKWEEKRRQRQQSRGGYGGSPAAGAGAAAGLEERQYAVGEHQGAEGPLLPFREALVPTAAGERPSTRGSGGAVWRDSDFGEPTGGRSAVAANDIFGNEPRSMPGSRGGPRGLGGLAAPLGANTASAPELVATPTRIVTPMINTASRDIKTPSTAKSQYLLDLEEQVREKQARVAAEKERERLEELRYLRDSEATEVFGRPGAGAPMRDASGRIVTDLRDLGHELITFTPTREARPKRSPVTASRPDMTPNSGMYDSSGASPGSMDSPTSGPPVRARRPSRLLPIAREPIDTRAMMQDAGPPTPTSVASSMWSGPGGPGGPGGAMAGMAPGSTIMVTNRAGHTVVLTAQQVQDLLFDNEMLQAQLVRYEEQIRLLGGTI